MTTAASRSGTFTTFSDVRSLVAIGGIVLQNSKTS